MSKPTALVILDGFGIASEKQYNAIAHAHMPHFNSWLSLYPHSTLQASGAAVGLPDGFQGNSEVGHLTIGAGRIIQQPMTTWLNEIENGSFYHNQTLLNNLNQLQNQEKAVHIMGLLSDAGIHSHEKQLYACIEAAWQARIKKIIVHAFLDGRDTPPQSAYDYLRKLEHKLAYYNHHAFIGSIHGRFYAMDRDHNWQRTESTYRVLTELQPEPIESWEKALQKQYAHGITDEFIVPTQLRHDATIKNGDGIIFCNTRPERARQLTASFVQPHFINFIVKPLTLTFFITPIEYSTELPTTYLFKRLPVSNTLKDILADRGKTIFSIAETEKYAHVTYFFRGENEATVRTEKRIMIPSLHVETYKNNPEMSAQKITDTVLHSLQTNPQDFYLINYANADMVGHSGDFGATIRAIEFLDTQLEQLYEIIVEKMNGTLYITADHGKAENMYDEDTHQPRTAHTCNLVPFVYINKEHKNSSMQLELHELSDIAPFIIKNMT